MGVFEQGLHGGLVGAGDVQRNVRLEREADFVLVMVTWQVTTALAGSMPCFLPKAITAWLKQAE